MTAGSYTNPRITITRVGRLDWRWMLRVECGNPLVPLGLRRFGIALTERGARRTAEREWARLTTKSHEYTYTPEGQA